MAKHEKHRACLPLGGKVRSILTAALCASALFACKERSALDTGADLAAQGTPDASSPFEAFKPANWVPVAIDRFQDQRLRGKLAILSLDIGDFGRLNGDFQGSINRMADGYFLREERWRTGTDVGPGVEILEDIRATSGLPVAIRLQANREITYSRKFVSQKAAFKAKVVTALSLPLNSEKALAMAPGDFVSMPVSMGLALGLEAAAAKRPFAVSAGTGLFWQGEFRINVYRHDGGFVRVKVAPSGERGISVQAHAGARLDVFNYKPGQLINLNRQSERLLGLDFFSWVMKRVQAGEQYAFDYMFNLDDPSARIAYDAVVAKTLRFKDSFVRAAATAQAGTATFKEIEVLADLTPAEYLNQMDSALPADKRRVARIFRGSDFYSGDSSAGRVGLKALRFSEARSLTSNKLQIDDGQPGAYFSAQLYESSKMRKSWLSVLREQQSMRGAAIFETNDDWSSHTPVNWSFEWTVSQSDLSPGEMRDVRELYTSVLGEDFSNSGVIRQDLPADNLRKFSANLRVAIDPRLIAQVKEMARRDPGSLEAVVRKTSSDALSRYREARSPLQFFVETSDAVRRGAFPPIAQAVTGPVIEATISAGQLTAAEYTTRLMRAVHDHPAGEVLVPGILFGLSRELHIPAYFAIEEAAANWQGIKFGSGRDQGSFERERLRAALYELSHLGYEN